MSRFIDQYLPDCIPGYPCTSSPVWSNTISRVSSGAENVRQLWSQPLHHYVLPVAARSQEILEGLKTMWMVMAGTAHTFPFRDPLDFASIELLGPNQEPPISYMDQVIGTGNGINDTFQLKKRYQVGANFFDRTITLPIVDSVIVSVDATPTTAFDVNRITGEVMLDTPPMIGQIVRAGFLFDVEVRFSDNDTYAGVVRAFNVSGFENINLIEVRPC